MVMAKDSSLLTLLSHKQKKVDEKKAEKLKRGYENVQYNLIFDAKDKLWDIFLPGKEGK